MEIFVNTDDLFFMVGAGACCVIPLAAITLGAIWASVKYKVVNRNSIEEKSP